MKKSLQLAATLVLALFAVQPVLAGLTCSMGITTSKPCAPDCGMAKGQMAADCPMSTKSAGTGCDKDCCRNMVPVGVLLRAANFKPKTGRVEFVFAAAPLNVAGAAASATPPPNLSAASPPARYILYQVFRI
jgi:hypothetical protein